MKKYIVVLASLVGCGGSSSTPSPDAPTVPAMITVSGKAEAYTTSGNQPLEGVRIGAYRTSDETTEVLFAMTDANGEFSMVIPTGGMPIDGFYKATIAGYMDDYLYPPGLIVEDFSHARAALVTPDTFTILADTLCGGNQLATNGTIVAIVADGAANPLAGATVGSTPGASKYCYNQAGYPNRNATSTDTDGIAYYLNVPPGKTTVTALKPGMTFTSHAVTARAGVLTTTLIAP